MSFTDTKYQFMSVASVIIYKIFSFVNKLRDKLADTFSENISLVKLVGTENADLFLN